VGRVISAAEFADICISLQEAGAENINIVTGSHAVPAIIAGLEAAKSRGLTLPVLWNSSAYESPNTLALLRDYIDIYLPDLKTLDSEIARKFFNAPDYPTVASEAIKTMMRYQPNNVIIRHLVLPRHLEATREVLKWFVHNAQGKAELSLMTQYTPIKNIKNQTENELEN
jgi:putative pyruvate formate lyase activating enzyme